MGPTSNPNWGWQGGGLDHHLDLQPTSFHHSKQVHSQSDCPMHSDGCQTLRSVTNGGSCLMVHSDGPYSGPHQVFWMVSTDARQ